MSENPYASPATAAEPVPPIAGSVERFPVATQGKRFLNLILDNIIVQVLSSVAGFVIGLAYGVSKVAANQAITADDEGQLRILGFIVGLGVALGYYVITEALFQRTLAKFVTGTLVVNANGERPSFGQIVGRSFARFIPFEAFSFLGGNQPVGWHDSLSSTRVVSTR